MFLKNLFNNTINFFYPPFKGIMSEQLFRYAFSGSLATCIDITIYFLSYHFLLKETNLHLSLFTLSPHVAAVLIAFVISFPIGFLLQKYITFTNSTLRGRVQLFRYLLIVVFCIVLNIVFIKLFVEQFHLFPTIAKIITTFIVVTFSYFTQRNYSFKEAKT
jgi:putative flippase GtrA